MGRIRTLIARPLGKLLVVVLLLVVAGGGTYAAAGGGRSSKATGPNTSTVSHATAPKPKSAAKVGAGDREDAVANVLEVDVKIGQYRSDYMTYAGISAKALKEYSTRFDASRYTVVATEMGQNFYVCSRSGKWYGEQRGLRKAAKATLKPSPLCRL
jgi:hypothetical protein